MLENFKKTVIILTIIAILFFANGCTRKQNKDNLSTNDNSKISNYMSDEKLVKKDKLTLLDLENLLETSNIVEVKNLENQVIGQIINGENIRNTVESIFSYDILDKYKDYSKEEVIATISFFPSGSYPVHGLIKEKSIYMEGYYFTSNKTNINEIIKYFETNTEAEPIATD